MSPVRNCHRCGVPAECTEFRGRPFCEECLFAVESTAEMHTSFILGMLARARVAKEQS